MARSLCIVPRFLCRVGFKKSTDMLVFGMCVEKKNQLEVTECFFALMICSTCFGHFYAHHQEL